jgi:hypothetical protein
MLTGMKFKLSIKPADNIKFPLTLTSDSNEVSRVTQHTNVRNKFPSIIIISIIEKNCSCSFLQLQATDKIGKSKVKAKLSSYRHAGAKGERIYSSYSFLTRQ